MLIELKVRVQVSQDEAREWIDAYNEEHGTRLVPDSADGREVVAHTAGERLPDLLIDHRAEIAPA